MTTWDNKSLTTAVQTLQSEVKKKSDNIIRKDNKILLIQVNARNRFIINEITPPLTDVEDDIKFLALKSDINWSSIKGSENILLTQDSSGDLVIDVSIDAFKDTEMYFKNGQIGVGRYPLHDYKVDVAVPVNTRMTAMHIGDGKFGFSLGNATDTGFLPQIIGIGSNETDAGLYFLGKTVLDTPSNIPLIIFDGRNINNDPLINRPIMGISSGSYTDYKFLIDHRGNVKITGDITILDSSHNEQSIRNEIEDLKRRLIALEKIK